MKSIGERNDVGPSRHFPGQLKCGFHGIGSGGAGELDFVIEFERRKNVLFKDFQKVLFGVSVHVEPMQ